MRTPLHALRFALIPLVLCGCAKTQTTPPAQCPQAQTQDVKQADAVQIHIQDQTITSNQNNIAIDLHYPAFGIESIDRIIAEDVQKTLQIERKELQETMDDARANGHQMILQGGLSFSLRYEIIRADSQGIDLLMTYSDYRGGAHDSLWLKTFMFDPKTGTLLPPLSIFGPDPQKALASLSEQARQKLPQILQTDALEDMVQSGTEPKPENFQNIVRKSENLATIYFEPYAVAPWAAGVLSIDVPW